MKNIARLSVFLTLMNCTMSPQDKIDHNEFQELHKHKGSENYEIVDLFDKKMEVKDKLLVDKQNGNIFAKAFQEDKLNDKKIFKTKRISSLGDPLEVLNHSYDVLNDGTLWYPFYYLNWCIDGDTTRHNYIDPFSNKEINDPYEFTAKETDHEKWMEKFKELYAKAQYIYIYMSDYYFKIDNKWYYIAAYKMGKANNIDIKKLYPPQRRPRRTYG